MRQHPAYRPSGNRNSKRGLSRGLLFLALLGVSPAGWAEAVFTGRLANRDIVFQLGADQPATVPTGTDSPIRRGEYFYRHRGIIIPLVARPDGWLAECRARFEQLICDKPTGYWLLSGTPAMPASQVKGEAFTLQAKWKASPSGPVTAVQLTAASVPADAQPDSWIRLLGTGTTQFTRGAERNGVAVDVLSDIRSGMKVPQLASGYPADITAQFNARLRTQLIRDAAGALENASLGGDQFDSSIVQYQSRQWLVWGGEVGGSFGGAHPQSSFDFKAFDMRTGKPVDARTSLFKHLPDPELEKLGESSTSFGIPAAQLKGRVVIESLVFREIEARAVQAGQSGNGWDEQQQDCFEAFHNQATDASTADTVSELTVSKRTLDKKTVFQFGFGLMPRFEGLAVVSNAFPEAARACRGVMFTIPWRKVTPYLNSPL